MAKAIHTCTGCVPIDASIIEAYVALITMNKNVSDAEDARVEAEEARVLAENARVEAEEARAIAETERERVAGEDHETAVSDHGIAVLDNETATSDHNTAVLDHDTAVEDHNSSTEATARANEAAAAAEHMVDIKRGPKGDQGNTGSSVDYPYELVNNVTTDDATKGLSAAQGVVLDGKISQLGQEIENAIKDSSVDFSISDEDGNDIVQFSDGHIKTKNFDSEAQPLTENSGSDFSISDEDGNDIVQFNNGHIKTKNFDSADISIDDIPLIENSDKDFAISDEDGNDIVQFNNGHIKTKNFDSENIAFDDVPSYYSAYLAEIADKINANLLQNSKNSDGLFFITDTHVLENALNGGKVIRKLQQITPIKKVVWGGDAITAFGSKASLDEQIFMQDEYLKKCDVLGVLFNTRGNHDYLIMDNPSDQDNGYIYSKAATRNILSNEKNKVVFDEDNPDTYFYYDNLIPNFRFIVLSTSESLGEGTTVGEYARNGIARPGTSGCTERMAKQWNWLFDVALNTEKNIVIISHIPFSLICSSSGNISYELRQTLRAYQNRRSIYNYDFSNAKGRIIACIAGHSHVDSQEMNDGILFVETSCDAYPNDNGTTKNVAINIVTDSRGLGTIKEQIIDYFNFDAGNNVVKTIRIGGGKDRYFHINTIELSMGDTYNVTTDFITALSWVSYNEGNHDNPDDVWPTWNGERNLTIPNDIVSVNNGVVTALKTGGANVVAISSDNEIELFYIKVV